MLLISRSMPSWMLLTECVGARSCRFFGIKRSKMQKKTAVKRRDCANFPKRAIDIDCPHFGPDTPGHAAIGPTNYLKTFPVAPENVRICPCIWTLTVKNRPKNGQDADRCCDVAWVLTGAPTMLGCLVWVPASCACPKRPCRVGGLEENRHSTEIC